MQELAFTVVRPNRPSEAVSYKVDKILCLGFAGRDQQKVREHIEELTAIGVECPSETPVIYPASGLLATTEGEIQVVGGETGPEVEFALIPYNNRLLVGLTSDHTDRALEAASIYKSKQMCPKPVSTVLWDYEDVADHWDELILRAWVTTADGKETLYQDSPASALLPVPDLLERVKKEYTVTPGNLILTGTVPTLGGLVTPVRFRASLYDPVLKREITLSYKVKDLLAK